MITLLYLLAGAIFIVGLRGLGSPRTARRGNQIAAAGMVLATLITVYYVYDLARDDSGLDALWWVIIVGLAIGGGIGALLALLSLPQATRFLITLSRPMPATPQEAFTQAEDAIPEDLKARFDPTLSVDEYPLWPLWYVVWAVWWVRQAGAWLVVGLFIAAILQIF